MRFHVTFLQLTALVHAYKHFPANVPKRWQLVSQLVERCSSSESWESSSCSPTFYVGVGTTTVNFDVSPDHCRRMCRDLEVHQRPLFSITEQQAQILFTDASKTPSSPSCSCPLSVRAAAETFSSGIYNHVFTFNYSYVPHVYDYI